MVSEVAGEQRALQGGRVAGKSRKTKTEKRQRCMVSCAFENSLQRDVA